ncbi:glycoside hydrolase family 2 TIM barrel-domain containing protein [Flammeovirga sp. OC4]|uniref:glycoside hydrolase family 2 protein n=1 Tax=Flammeovirga sp. OC4 TaxID=1382345 RepID=UPI0005C5BB82|nr:glycoside hydrolase family 2 TIM barrel-domain containing protein [Flammeovirga sp. OC4]
MKRIYLWVLWSISLLGTTTANAREIKNINKEWQYLEQPITDIVDLKSSDHWINIDLPHTWNNEDAVDLTPGYRRSISWYKKVLNFKSLGEQRRFLYFEGVNITTEVYVNGQKAGQHIGGYLGFEIELTEFLKEGDNEIVVKVDNSYDPQVIPSQKSDFFIYGGITRDVWLKSVDPAYINDVKITLEEASREKAIVDFQVYVDGELQPKDILVLRIKDPEGNIVDTIERSAKEKSQGKITLSKPTLWSTTSPNLYSVEVELKHKKQQTDAIIESFGVRWFEFKKNGPFYLNGERLLLRGTHRHEEHAGVGAAMSNQMHREDMELIKSMGANFVRLAHYPQDPEIYKACDELGILIWDEVPWCRGGVGDEVWKTNTKNMLKEMIDQNYNHPSIIIWSLGNEIYWLPDFEGGDDVEKMNSFLKEMNDLAHELDPSRKTAIRKYYDGATIVDVFSPSIWSGWYSGAYTNYKTVVDKSIQDYNHFFHMEYGGSSHLGRHTETPITGEGKIQADHWEEEVNQLEVTSISKIGDWSENYIVDLFDWYLSVSETHDQFVGNAQWAFKDFGTPLRPENDIPYINQKGLLDRAGNPKDAFYVFKSYWSEEPFSYIESHTWTERSGKKGKPRNVCVYSNNAEVEFFLNGKSQGKKKRDITSFPACGLNWDIQFEEGNNQLHCVGYNDGQEVSRDSMHVNYSFEKAGTPHELKLTSQLLQNGNYLFTVTARDKEGRRCLNYEERVYFQCLMGGDLLKNQGTPTGSESIKMANGKAEIEVIPHSTSEKIQMSVLNQNFKGSYLETNIIESTTTNFEYK